MHRRNADHAGAIPVSGKVRDGRGGEDGPAAAAGAAVGRLQLQPAGRQRQVRGLVSEGLCRGGGRRRPSEEASQQAGGPAGPTGVVDAQRQREPTPLTLAGDRHRADNRHLVLPAVLRHLKGVWEKLTGGNEDEAQRR